ncbi:MAG: glycosyltransferase N-terminal domain-containing protein [Candidatus Pacebacteria bacterium]|nr:glycosyltransferase N-terminal domain-containing protein [Candidatus Paceibacterota bacterium]
MVWLQIQLYRGLWWLLTPLLPHYLARRCRAGREDGLRWREKLGQPSLPRPSGPLVWIHGASVGEILSALIIIDGLLQREDSTEILITTGTVTSARLMGQRRVHPRLRHQFMPLDHPRAVKKFIQHWRPDRVMWLESELWPNFLRELKRSKIPVQLVNGRLSESSRRHWRRWGRGLATQLLGCFTEILPQSAGDAERFASLGARRIGMVGNLKLLAPPLPVDEARLTETWAAIGHKPIWLAASTHPREESMIAASHQRLVSQFPELITVIVPRHPERGEAIVSQISAQFPTLRLGRRSLGDGLDAGIFIADSLGELGLWYRAIPLVLMGGSLVQHGGQNPLEPLHFGCAVVVGPHMENFAELVESLFAVPGIRQFGDSDKLAAVIAEMLLESPAAATLGLAGQGWLKQQTAQGQKLIDHLLQESTQ